MAAPFTDQVEQLIRSEIAHIHSVKAIPLGGKAFELTTESVELAYDEDWTPHVQGSLTMPLPDDEILAALDARIGCVIEVTAGYLFGVDDEETIIMAQMQLRGRTINHETDSVTLRLEGREAILQGYILHGNEQVSRETLTDYVHDVVAYTLLPSELSSTRLYSELSGTYKAALAGTPEDIANESTELRPELGKSAWEMLAEAQRRTGTWIYSPDGNTFLINKRPEITETPVHTLTVGEAGTVISAESNLGIDDFYNEVIFKYEWRDDDRIPAEQQVLGHAYAQYGPYAANKVRRRTYVETIDRRVSKKEADAAARDKLSRLITKGHEYTVNAISAYWVRPGETVALNLGDKTIKLLVKSVKFDFSTGVMVLTLRTPEIVTITSET